MHAYLSRVFLLIITMSVSMAVIGQPPTGTRPDTARRTPPSPTNGPKPYKEVITSKAISDGGLFWVHKVEDKYYFEIPDFQPGDIGGKPYIESISWYAQRWLLWIWG